MKVLSISYYFQSLLILANLTIVKLDILEDLDFFELSAETLSGFRGSIKATIENMAKSVLQDGIDTRPFTSRLERYGLSKLGFYLLDEGLVLTRADVDVYKLVFDNDFDNI